MYVSAPDDVALWGYWKIDKF